MMKLKFGKGQDMSHKKKPAEFPQTSAFAALPTPQTSSLKLSQIRIDPEFQTLLRTAVAEEFERLREEIVRDGFRNAIVVWKDHGILLDGHHRLEIWRKWFGADDARGPKIIELAFETREAAKDWMLRNQLSRRNLTDIERIQITDHFRPQIAQQAKDNQRRGGRSETNKARKPIDTLQQVADTAGLSRTKVYQRDKVLQRGAPELIDAMNKTKISINAAYDVAKLSHDEQRTFLAAYAKSPNETLQSLRDKHANERAERTSLGKDGRLISAARDCCRLLKKISDHLASCPEDIGQLGALKDDLSIARDDLKKLVTNVSKP